MSAPTLGSYLHRALGDRVAAIAFSAYSGGHAMIRRPVTQLPPASPESLESKVFAAGGSDTRYLDHAQLAGLGVIAGRPIELAFWPAAWAEVFDGIVVLRQERPPRFVRGGRPRRAM